MNNAESRDWYLDDLNGYLCAQFEELFEGAEDLDSRRLFHGRGHNFPTLEYLNIDFHHRVILITAYRASDAGFEQAIADNLWVLGQALGVEAVVVQRRYKTEERVECLAGKIPELIFARESALRYELDLSGRQNIGFFLDMSPGRQWLAERAKGKRVLNLFAYTCAFSVVARKVGAESVVNLDMSRAAIRCGQRNHQHNQLLGGVSYLAHELFKSWGKLKKRGPFDLIVVDPPSRQPGSFIAAKDYPRLLRRLPELAAGTAEFLICLNDPNVEFQAFRSMVEESCPALLFECRLGNREDFPEVDQDKNLKVLHYRVNQ